MSNSKFFVGLLISVVSSFGLFFLIDFFVDISDYFNLQIWAVVLFSLFCIGIYFLGKKSLKSKAGNFLISIVMINVLLKLLFSFLFVFLYAKYQDPDDTLFVIPFLGVYLIFLIFETYFLSIQARSSK